MLTSPSLPDCFVTHISSSPLAGGSLDPVPSGDEDCGERDIKKWAFNWNNWCKFYFSIFIDNSMRIGA